MNESVLAAPEHLPESPQQRDKTQRELLGFIEKEVKSRLKHSLHERIFITLDRTEDSCQANPLWSIDLKVGTSEPKRLPSNTKITEIYDRQEINGRLLILGAPGSGKTTTLLQLAIDLINRAQEDGNQPIPVLLNLSSWKNEQDTLKEWIVDDLKQKYGVRKDIGKKWLDEATVIPLLDGLDEVASDIQELCLEKIQEFLQPEKSLNPLILCSSESVQHLDDLVGLNGSITLQPLTPEQIEQYLQLAGEERLREKIKNDETLMELAKTPFLLNIINPRTIHHLSLLFRYFHIVMMFRCFHFVMMFRLLFLQTLRP